MRRISKRDAEDAIYLNHAVKAMTSRQVSIEEIEEVLVSPKTVWGPDYRGRYNYANDDICVVASTGKGRVVIVTVLWRNQEQWTDEEFASRTEKKRA